MPLHHCREGYMPLQEGKDIPLQRGKGKDMPLRRMPLHEQGCPQKKKK